MRRALPVVLALALVVLAGCSGLGGQGTDTATTDVDTTVPSTDRTATSATGQPETTQGTSGDSAQAVKADALAALDAVETYRVRANQTSRVTGNLARTVTTNTTGVFDRAAMTARLNQSQDAGAVAVTVQSYLVDETLYQRSPAFAQQYDSNWIAADLSENYTQAWEQYDTLTRQRALLNASDVTLNGTETVAGREVHVLDADIDVERFEDLGVDVTRQGLDVSDVSTTFYVDTETSRLVASTTRLNATRTVDGQSVTIDQRIDLRFSGYGEPVSIDLPEEAEETAVRLGNATAAPTTEA